MRDRSSAVAAPCHVKVIQLLPSLHILDMLSSRTCGLLALHAFQRYHVTLLERRERIFNHGI